MTQMGWMSKNEKSIFHVSNKQKQAGVAILRWSELKISGNLDFTGDITCLLIRWPVQREGAGLACNEGRLQARSREGHNRRWAQVPARPPHSPGEPRVLRWKENWFTFSLPLSQVILGTCNPKSHNSFSS